MEEIVEGVKPIITPNNFEDKNDAVELVTALNQINKLQNSLSDYATNFIKSFHKNADEVAQYIPESDIDNWKILPNQLNIFYPQKYSYKDEKYFRECDGLNITELLRSISGDSKAYFINFDKKEVNFFWDDSTKFLLPVSLYQGECLLNQIYARIDNNKFKVEVTCGLKFISHKREPAPGAVMISGRYWNKEITKEITEFFDFNHTFCLKTNKYKKLQRKEF